jgi:hypothetical protein
MCVATIQSQEVRFFPMEAAELFADRLVRSTLGFADPDLRVSAFVNVLRESPVDELAPALDALARRGEMAEPMAREVLVPLANALLDERVADRVQRLREEAAGNSLLALGRLVRATPDVSLTSLTPTRSASPVNPDDEHVPDYGRGRTLTLGERKSLARRPDRETVEKLVRDPHPEVIRKLLANPRLTEDDVVRLVSKRPSRADILTAIARSPKWVRRTRVRLSLLLHPDLPSELASPIIGLLVRQELRLVAQSTHVPAPVRALCLEHLERRPPARFPEDPPPPTKLQ